LKTYFFRFFGFFCFVGIFRMSTFYHLWKFQYFKSVKKSKSSCSKYSNSNNRVSINIKFFSYFKNQNKTADIFKYKKRLDIRKCKNLALNIENRIYREEFTRKKCTNHVNVHKLCAVEYINTVCSLDYSLQFRNF